VGAIMTILQTLDYAPEHIHMAIEACEIANNNTPVEIGDVLKKLWPYYHTILTMPIPVDVPIPLAPLPLHADDDDDTALDVGPDTTHHEMHGPLNQPIDTKLLGEFRGSLNKQIDAELLNEYTNILQKVMCNMCGENPATALFIPCRHLITCCDCAKTIDICGKCKKEIVGTLKVYTC
jgi:hypothetical protein